MDHKSLRANAERKAAEHVKRAGYATGGKVHEDEAQDKKLVKRMIREREHGKPIDKLKPGGTVKGHPPKHRLDKRARGGATDNVESLYAHDRNASRTIHESEYNVDKEGPPKRASGGRAEGKKGKGHGKVNVIVQTGGGQQELQQAQQEGVQKGVQLGAQMVMKKLQGAGAPPPGAGGPPPGAPPGAAPGAPPQQPPHPPMAGPPGGAMKRGGHVEKKTVGGEIGARDSANARYNAEERGDGKDEVIKVRAHERRRRGGSCED